MRGLSKSVMVWGSVATAPPAALAGGQSRQVHHDQWGCHHQRGRQLPGRPGHLLQEALVPAAVKGKTVRIQDKNVTHCVSVMGTDGQEQGPHHVPGREGGILDMEVGICHHLVLVILVCIESIFISLDNVLIIERWNIKTCIKWWNTVCQWTLDFYKLISGDGPVLKFRSILSWAWQWRMWNLLGFMDNWYNSRNLRIERCELNYFFARQWYILSIRYLTSVIQWYLNKFEWFNQVKTIDWQLKYAFVYSFVYFMPLYFFFKIRRYISKNSN